MKKINIWCYRCGSKWHEREVHELYNSLLFARCPLGTGGPTQCNGYTDGIEVEN